MVNSDNSLQNFLLNIFKAKISRDKPVKSPDARCIIVTGQACSPHAARRTTTRYLMIAARQAWITWIGGENHELIDFCLFASKFKVESYWAAFRFAASHIWGWRKVRSEWLQEFARLIKAQKRRLGLFAYWGWLLKYEARGVMIGHWLRCVKGWRKIYSFL